MDLINRVARSNYDINRANKIRRDLSNSRDTGTGSFIRQTQPEPLDKEIPFLQEIDTELQQLILKIWGEMNLGLDREIINRLVNYIENWSENELNSQKDLASAVKTFAFMTRNNIPLLPSLIRGLEENINPNHSFTSMLDESQPLTEKILNLLGLNPNAEPEVITEKLQNYSGHLQQAIEILSGQEETGDKNKLTDFLLGQQALNLPHSEESGILLSLTLPLISPQEKKPLPCHLQIWEEDSGSQNEKSEKRKSLHINFIIELKNLGTVKNETIIKEKTLHCKFTTEKKTTAKLIEKKFPALVKNLEKLGYNLSDPEIRTKKHIKRKTRLVRNQKKNNPGVKKYTHIDVRA
ncbi:MAG: flagellar hook-length control protein FliK [Halanaerobiaceae bacterium]